MTSLDFYQQIKPFSKFAEVTSDRHYTKVPEDWAVIITDIQGSTKAIQNGKYRDVNFVGAATIATIMNELNHLDFPYIFGGDGATLILPTVMAQKLVQALSSTKYVARKNFDLSLRVGMVSVKELNAAGKSVEVAKFEIAPDNYIALIKGEGIYTAENWIKQDAKYQINTETPAQAEFKGLSCRWEPIKSGRGKILTLIILPKEPEKSTSIIDGLIKEVESMTGINFLNANPVKLKQLKQKTIPSGTRLETSLGVSVLTKFAKTMIAAIQGMLMKFLCKYNIKFGPMDPARYKQEMADRADFRKYDGYLRMVLDCTDAEIKTILEILEKEYKAGSLFYGYHISEHAIMTCLLNSLESSKHIHFIDGSEGGYTMAASILKKQLKAKQ